MPRTREFDASDVLEKAMQVFWKKGYANTSIGDLVKETGVNRYGLYSAFDTKQGLFLASLDHYQETVVSSVFGIVEEPEASLDNIKIYFKQLLVLSVPKAVPKNNRLGCFMVNTASDVAPYDKKAKDKVAQYRTRLTAGFQTALTNAKNNHQLPKQFDAKANADFLAGAVLGLSVMSRSHSPAEMMKNFILTTLSCLQENNHQPSK